MNLKNYSFESIPTESSTDGTLPYISNRLSNKPNFDLNILKNQAESTFIEIINTKKANIVVGSIAAICYKLWLQHIDYVEIC